MSTNLLQRSLIKAYGTVAERGWLDRGPGRSLFEVCYGTYKLLWEAGTIGQLRALATPGTMVVDVGANVGFFTVRFARWVRPGGRVLAIEPEALNAAQLARRMQRKADGGRVEIVQGVATDHEGVEHLFVNRHHPGDHRIGLAGLEGAIPVPAHTIDGLLAGRPACRVSLIKIDVQGAELRVLRGASATLAAHRPALFVEIDEPRLQEFGTSGREVIAHLTAQGYTGHRVSRRGIGPAEEPAALAAAFARRYGDVLFLPRS
ncbi:MAG: FkbM family methyltransferase [Acidimicrobiales bacterium]